LGYLCPKMMAARVPRTPIPPRARTWGGMELEVCVGAGVGGTGAAAGVLPGMKEVSFDVMSFRLIPISGLKEFRNPKSNIVRAMGEL